MPAYLAGGFQTEAKTGDIFDLLGQPEDALERCGIDEQMVLTKLMHMAEGAEDLHDESLNSKEVIMERLDHLLPLLAPEHEELCSGQDLARAKTTSAFMLFAAMGTQLSDGQRIDFMSSHTKDWLKACMDSMDLELCFKGVESNRMDEMIEALEDNFRLFCEHRKDSNDALPSCYVHMRGAEVVGKDTDLALSLGALEKLACLVGLFCGK